MYQNDLEYLSDLLIFSERLSAEIEDLKKGKFFNGGCTGKDFQEKIENTEELKTNINKIILELQRKLSYRHREIIIHEPNSLARELEIIFSMQGMKGIFTSSDAHFIDGKWINSVLSGTIDAIDVTEFGPHYSPNGEGIKFTSCKNLVEVYFYIKTEEEALKMVNAATIYIK